MYEHKPSPLRPDDFHQVSYAELIHKAWAAGEYFRAIACWIFRFCVYFANSSMFYASSEIYRSSIDLLKGTLPQPSNPTYKPSAHVTRYLQSQKYTEGVVMRAMWEHWYEGNMTYNSDTRHRGKLQLGFYLGWHKRYEKAETNED